MKNTKKHILQWITAGVLLFLCFRPEYIKRLIYPYTYATPYHEKLEVWETDVFKDLGEKQLKPFTRNYNGLDITFYPQRFYETTAKIGILERYEGWWEKFYHGHDKNRQIYNSFSPIDLALVHGYGAVHPKFGSCFHHEYRLLWSCPEIDRNYFNNYHIIPANENLKKGLETLHNGDIIRIKGVLVNVKVPNWHEMKTGTSHSMTHQDQFAGGLYTGMCFIIYLKELVVDGYIYR